MIPEEAVQAAHAAICEQNLDDCLDPDWRGKCVKAVEAAAPHIRAQAFEDAATDIEDRRPEMGPQINITDYRRGRESALALAAHIMRARAAEALEVGPNERA